MRIVSAPHTGTVFTRDLLGMSHHWHFWFPGRDWLDVEGLAANGERIVMPMRDPVLAFITFLNCGDDELRVAEQFARMAECYALPGVHVFRVDAPDQEHALADLSAFMGKPLSWVPRNPETPDRTGYRAAYLRGEMPGPLQGFVDNLDPQVFAMLRALGYALFWMEGR